VEQILGLKVKGQGHWKRKCKIVFRPFFVKSGSWFTSNQDRNDHRRIHFINGNAFV